MRQRFAKLAGAVAGRRRPVFSNAAGEAATIVYILLIGFIAQATGFIYVLFPELGALSHDIFKRPHGTWARAPAMLVLTPFLTAVVGSFITRNLAYGFGSILLTIACAIAIIRLFKSPIAPAISAGLLPLTLGLTSWWYPPSLLVGTGLLAATTLVWRRVMPIPSFAGSPSDIADDVVEEAPGGYSHVPFFLAFLVIAAALASATGWRLLLYPPLVVIGFEMFAHAAVCPWAGRPVLLPVACALAASGGVLFVSLLGLTPWAAALSIFVSVTVLRVFDLHVPPALAVGLLPFIIPEPTYRFPIAVAAGTLLLTVTFVAWRRLLGWSRARKHRRLKKDQHL